MKSSHSDDSLGVWFQGARVVHRFFPRVLCAARLASIRQTADSHSTAVEVGSVSPPAPPQGASRVVIHNRPPTGLWQQDSQRQRVWSQAHLLPLFWLWDHKHSSELSLHLLVEGMIRGRVERVKGVCALERASRSEGLDLGEQGSIKSWKGQAEVRSRGLINVASEALQGPYPLCSLLKPQSFFQVKMKSSACNANNPTGALPWDNPGTSACTEVLCERFHSVTQNKKRCVLQGWDSLKLILFIASSGHS